MKRKVGLCHRVDLVERITERLGGPDELLVRNPVALCTGQRCSMTRVHLDISEDAWAVLFPQGLHSPLVDRLDWQVIDYLTAADLLCWALGEKDSIPMNVDSVGGIVNTEQKNSREVLYEGDFCFFVLGIDSHKFLPKLSCSYRPPKLFDKHLARILSAESLQIFTYVGAMLNFRSVLARLCVLIRGRSLHAHPQHMCRSRSRSTCTLVVFSHITFPSENEAIATDRTRIWLLVMTQGSIRHQGHAHVIHCRLWKDTHQIGHKVCCDIARNPMEENANFEFA